MREVQLGEPPGGGSARSAVIRATALRDGHQPPLAIVIKTGSDGVDHLRREQAALTVARDHRLPGVVALLGVCDDPPALILRDLGTGPSVADLLLGDDRAAAGQAIVDWAVTIGRLQAASAAAGEGFGAALTRLSARDAALRNPNDRFFIEAADDLAEALAPFGLEPDARALAELRGLADPATAPAELAADPGLVPGDSCPDNAVYADGHLTLIDFESAAFRAPVWEAAYLSTPWPTCWCSWDLPEDVRGRALTALTDTLPETMRFSPDALTIATIAWSLVTVVWVLAHLARPDRPLDVDPRRPDWETLVLHRLALAAGAATEALPALRELSATLHARCEQRWGPRTLGLAPAFR